MAQISLTDFVDIVSKAGEPKTTKVRQVKERPEYEPAFDFYKPLRDHIIDTHRSGADKNSLSNVLSSLTDSKKIKNYPAVISGYKKWWGKKNLKWFSPPRDVYANGGVEIIINPEIGLEINGQRHVVKLYFKPIKLSAFNVRLITDIMEHQLRDNVNVSDKFAVLDVRNAKLFPGSGVATSIPTVNAEIAYIASLWDA